MVKVTVITSVKALNGGVGQIFLDRMFLSFENIRYVRLIPTGGKIPGVIGKAISKTVLKSKIVGVADFVIDIFLILPVLTVYLLTVKRNTCLFVTMSSRTIYRAVWIVSYFRKKQKLVSIVWDMPSYLMDFNSRRFNWINRLDNFFFNQVISNSNVVITMGNRMDLALANRLKKLPHSMHVRSALVTTSNKATPKPPSDTLKIVFAGSIYAKVTWNSFVNALSDMAWEIEGVKIELHLIGRVPMLDPKLPIEIKTYGQLEHRQVSAILENCDIGYVPYSFDNNFKEAALTSWPGKISDYVASDLPFFYHGPKESEVFDAIQRSGAGVLCASMESTEIVRALKEIIRLRASLNGQIPNFIKNELSFDPGVLISSIEDVAP